MIVESDDIALRCDAHVNDIAISTVKKLAYGELEGLLDGNAANHGELTSIGEMSPSQTSFSTGRVESRRLSLPSGNILGPSEFQRHLAVGRDACCVCGNSV